MVAASRRWIGFAVVIAACAALLWWWLGRSPAPDSSAPPVAASDRKDGPKTAKPIGADAEDEDEAPSKLPWKRPVTSVSGRVIDEAGKPVANANVCATLTGRRLPAELEREPFCTTSAADGVYVLTKLPPLRIGISASAATYRPGHYDPPGKFDTLDLRLGKEITGIDITVRSGGVQVSGIVKDIAGGVVEGALVQAHAGRWSSAAGRTFTKTDAKGEFVAWVAPGDIQVSATADGYAPGEKDGPAPGFTFEILLTPESVIAGRVVRKSDGKPVADAHVAVDRWFFSSGGTYTDADGYFRLDRLEPGRYKPAATAVDSYGELAESVRLGLGQTIDDVVIEAHPMASLRGRIVVAGTGTSCERGALSMTGRVSKHEARGEIGDDGEVEVHGLPPDTYAIQPSCAGYVAKSKYPDIVVAEAAIVDQTWEVDAGLSIRGIVVDQDGTPIADASVSAKPVDNAARGQQTFGWGEQTDKEGKFEMDGLVPGNYEVEANHDDHVTPEPAPRIAIVAGEATAEQRLVLEAGGTITGRVLDANRRAVSGAQVRVVGKRWWGGGSAHTADDGTFTMKAVRPGEHRIVANRGWFNEMRAPGTTDDDVQGVTLTVRAGETSSVDLVVEEQFGKIEGRVIDSDGGPVDDAFIHATRVSDSAAASAKGVRASVRWGAWTRTPALTDQDGTFALDDLEVGTHSVMAMRKGGGEGVVENVKTGTSGVVVQLSEGGSLSGKVALASGGSPKRFSVSASAPAAGMWRDESFFETGGTFKMTDLPAGLYDLTVTAAEGTTTAKVELALGKDESGISLVLTPKVDVTGTVVDVKTGAPVPAMKVSIMPRKGGGFSFGGDDGDQEDVTDASGKFKVVAAPSGPVRVMVMPRNFFGADDASYGWHNLTANIPGESNTFELPPIKVAAGKAKMGERGGDFGITFKDGEPEQEQEELPLQIAVIRPGSPAAASELKVGDIIVDVDGQDVTGANRYLYHSLVHVNEGDKVTFGVEGGKSVTLIAGKPV